jgi:hypothetical protein
VAGRASEPAAFYWTIGVLVSVALHAGLIAGVALLAGRNAQASAPTEITFSDEASPAVDPLKSQAQPAAPSAVASTAEHETVAPAASSEASVKPQAEAVKPIAGETAKPEAVRPTETAALAPEMIRPSSADQQPAEALPSAEPERVQGSSAEPVAAAGADAVKSEASGKAVPAGQPQQRTAPDGDAEKVAVQAPERVVAPPAAGSQSALPGEAAEKVAAQERPAGVEPSAVIGADQQPPEAAVAGSAPDSAAPIAGESAAPVSDPNPEKVATSVGESATPASDGNPEKVAALQQPESIGAAPAVAPQDPRPDTAPAEGPERVTALGAPTPAGEALGSTAPETVRPAAPASGGTGVASAPATGAETARPLTPAVETVTGAPPQPGQPGGEIGSGTGHAAQQPPTRPETVQPEQPFQTALLVPASPNSVLGTEVDQPTDRYRRIVDFIRGYGGGDCFIALPAMNPDGVVTFQTFGRDKAREDEFRHALGAVDELRTEISSGDVADPQCLALGFARTTKRYPGFSLVIDLNESEMASGTKLSGKVLNANGRDLHLLLVDDEGMVQSIDSFFSADRGSDRPFSVPLTLTGGKPVATKQILIAIATDPPLWGLDKVGKPAADFFHELATQVEASHADVDLAVEGFSVR